MLLHSFMSIVLLLVVPFPIFEDNALANDLPTEQAWQVGSACGPNALYCLLAVYGKHVEYDVLLRELSPSESGSSLEELRTAAQRHGLKTAIYKSDRQGFDQMQLPFIAHLEQYDFRHYVVVTGRNADNVFVWDDVNGTTEPMRVDKFFKLWTGYALTTGNRSSEHIFKAIIAVQIAFIIILLFMLIKNNRTSNASRIGDSTHA